MPVATVYEKNIPWDIEFYHNVPQSVTVHLFDGVRQVNLSEAEIDDLCNRHADTIHDQLEQQTPTRAQARSSQREDELKAGEY